MRTFKGSGSKAIIEILKNLGIDRVFGIPGIQNIELYDELLDSAIEPILVTNESSAAFMADAHARVTGQLGVMIAVPGPGITNMFTGLAEALLDSSPVLAIVCSKNESKKHSFQLHEIDQCSALKPLVKGIFKPANLTDTAKVINEAAELALSGEPGPVVVEIPTNYFYEVGVFAIPDWIPQRRHEASDQELDIAADILIKSPAVGIYAGAGAMKASPLLIDLADLLQSPVATTVSGRGVIPEDYPLSVGYGFGPSGTNIARHLFKRVHTLLAIGCKYTEFATGAYGLKIPKEHIHIDINPASIGTNYPASIQIVADASWALEGLVKRLRKRPRPANISLQKLIKAKKDDIVQKIDEAKQNKQSVNPSRLLMILRKKMEREGVVVTDCGNHQLYALSSFPVFSPHTFITPSDYQAMGFSIPAAIAAKLASSGRPVVSLIGDGGFLFSGMELLTAVRMKIGIIVIIFHDGALGLIETAQQRLYRRPSCSRLINPDYRLLAQSFGIRYIPINNDMEIEGCLDQAFGSDGPVIIDANVSYKYPPMYLKGASWSMYNQLPLRLKMRILQRYIKKWLR